MKFLVLIILSTFILNVSPVYSQTDSEIQELMKKLELLKKKKAQEEKTEKKSDNKEITESSVETAKTENSSLDDKLAKIAEEKAKRKAVVDSLSMINDFERDSSANEILNQKRFVNILINNEEVDSVELEIDNVSKGKVRVPYLIENVSEGWHKVYVRNAWGFVDYKEGLFNADSVYKLKFKAGIPKSEIAVNSTPKQAQIFLNDSLVGLSPVTVKGLKPGKYKISMKSQGFSSYETEVELNGLFNPELYAELNEEAPETFLPVYAQPEKITGAALGTAALVTGIIGIIKHSSATDYFDDAKSNGAKSNDYREEGDKVKAAEELANEQKNNQIGTEKRDTANTLLMISFVTLSFSVPLLTF